MNKHNLYEALERAHLKTAGKALYIPGVGYLLGWGTTVPTDGDAGWAPGARFHHTDGTANATMVYTNQGSVTSCNFDSDNAPTFTSATVSGALGVTGDLTVTGALSAAASLPIINRISFAEAGEGTYTGSASIPAGYSVVDVIVSAYVAWSAATSAALEVGDATDPDGYFTSINLKSAPTVGSPVSFAEYDSGVGAYKNVAGKAYAAAGNVIAKAVSVGAGTNGRTVVEVVAVPTAYVIAAAKA